VERRPIPPRARIAATGRARRDPVRTIRALLADAPLSSLYRLPLFFRRRGRTALQVGRPRTLVAGRMGVPVRGNARVAADPGRGAVVAAGTERLVLGIYRGHCPRPEFWGFPAVRTEPPTLPRPDLQLISGLLSPHLRIHLRRRGPRGDRHGQGRA